MGDFQEPKGAVNRVFTKVFPQYLPNANNGLVYPLLVTKASKNFCYNLAKGLQEICNLQSRGSV